MKNYTEHSFIVHLLLANWHEIPCWDVLGHGMSCGVTGYTPSKTILNSILLIIL